MRIGSRTFVYEHPPRIAAHASIVGPKESKGPLAAYFDESSQDDLFGQKTWEMGESEMLRRCAARAMEMGGLAPEETQALFCGDLNDQIIATGFAARALGVPLVIARRDSRAYEGSAVKINYVSGGDRIETMALARRAVRAGQRALIIDDFMANGEAMRGLCDIVNAAGATLVGIGCAVEKGFQGGGDRLRAAGVNLKSLAIIESAEPGNIVFRDED